MKRDEAYRLLACVVDEYRAAQYALSHTLSAAARDPSLLRQAEHPVAPSHLRHCAANLEITYILRLFASFEGIARDYWATCRNTQPRMETLLNRLAALRSAPASALVDAHEVCAYRNDVVHHHLRQTVLTFDECKSRISYFLSFLPLHW